ncbi:efflux RND transporter permease subunit [Aerophototrophica crusticola]|uniref:Efflux RND transporter permease subunit n=1 Tax=Aerophototrophica crusticola TaxID=1709002 RepID=A0A858RAL9_9PROT|nr:efflux RND transporter permease subunit [Rhodospirillaceae bacterium B3]
MNPGGLIRTFVRHKVAANILMLLMILSGAYAVLTLDRQIDPDFEVPAINVVVPWPGASADDVDRSIVEALEREVRFLDGIDDVTGRSREGIGELFINFKNGTDMSKALSEVESAIAGITTLPQGSEEPIVRRLEIYDEIMELVISGPLPEPALRAHAKRIRDQLMDRGVDRVDMLGMRDVEIWVEIPAAEMERLDMTLGDVARRVGQASSDVPSGSLTGGIEKQVRSLGEEREAAGVAGLTLRTDDQGRRLMLGEVAKVHETYEEGSVSGRRGGNPSIKLSLQKAKNGDLIAITGVVDQYLAGLKPPLPPGVTVEVFDRNSDALQDRIAMLVDNAVWGMLLVVAVLYVFLRPWITAWITVDVLTSLAVTFAIMLVLDQSINMMSLFALIMMVGIICDDAIVVAEQAQTYHERGWDPNRSVEYAARRMFWPVTAAAVTTVAAFGPMLMMRGTTGDFVEPLPMVAIAVILASLFGCFLILPAHLKHGLEKDNGKSSKARLWFEHHFHTFRDGPFTRAIQWATDNRYSTIAAAIAVMMVAVGLMMGGRVHFTFSPTPEGQWMNLNVLFSPGTPKETVAQQLDEAEAALYRVEQKLGYQRGEMIHMVFGRLGATTGDSLPEQVGDYVGSMNTELIAADARDHRLPDIMKQWEAETKLLPGIDQIIFSEERVGFGGSGVGWRLVHDDPYVLKKASEELKAVLATYGGVSGIRDNLPTGKPELVLKVTPRGEALGFTTELVGRQLRDALDGAVAKRFARGDEEVTIRVRLPESDQTEEGLRQFRLRSPAGEEVLLGEVVELHERPGLARILRSDGKRVLSVFAEVDPHVSNPGKIREEVEKEHLPKIMEKYGVSRNMSDGSQQEAEFWADFMAGVLVALAAIYLVLAWIMGSFARPVAVMAVIPFSVGGAIFGHWFMGADMTMMSYISIMGMSGILVNDSIQVVTSIDERTAAGQPPHYAVVHGAAERLRQVALTSLTTIFGLLPLMLETELQAQFLVPMAITFVFGIGTATVLVLLLMPAMLLAVEDAKHGLGWLWLRMKRGGRWLARDPDAPRPAHGGDD